MVLLSFDLMYEQITPEKASMGKKQTNRHLPNLFSWPVNNLLYLSNPCQSSACNESINQNCHGFGI